MKFSTKDRNIFITSDLHYSHKNLIKSLTNWDIDRAKRDFNSIEEHNNKIVENINNTVGKDDVLFILGDIAFGGVKNIPIVMDRIICDEVHLIFGNHDHHIITNKNGIKDWFTTTSFYREVLIDKELFVMFHYPISEWNGFYRGAYHLYGHQHNLSEHIFSNKGKSMDVGIDGHPEFRPYNINEIRTLLKSA